MSVVVFVVAPSLARTVTWLVTCLDGHVVLVSKENVWSQQESTVNLDRATITMTNFCVLRYIRLKRKSVDKIKGFMTISCTVVTSYFYINFHSIYWNEILMMHKFVSINISTFVVFTTLKFHWYIILWAAICIFLQCRLVFHRLW